MGKTLKLVVPKNFEDFGKKVNNCINLIRDTKTNYIVDMNLIRFGNGEGKCQFGESVRDYDLYILSDPGNYDVVYSSRGKLHNMMPDEHYQDIKRIINAVNGHASRLVLVMPYLYQSRQDKRSFRESLDCAMALQELERYDVHELITFDAHNPLVANAIPNRMIFSNGYATGELILSVLENEKLDIDNLFIVSPDSGARPKAKFLADILGGIKFGNFDKRRDYTKIENGQHPIEYHEFVGPENLENQDVIIVDDMISSGSSLIAAAKQLKQRGAKNVYLMVTFALFTDGIGQFEEAYYQGIFTKLYATNLSYVPNEIKKYPWYVDVDCSYRVAQIISYLNEGKSIRELLNGKESTAQKVLKYRNTINR